VICPRLPICRTAQPCTFRHHLLAWFEMLSPDRERLMTAARRVKTACRLASAAFGTGTTYSGLIAR